MRIPSVFELRKWRSSPRRLGMTNVFKIRHGKETHVYRTDISADKKNLLTQFRHVAEELAAKKRKEREGEHQRRKSTWIGDVGIVLCLHNRC